MPNVTSRIGISDIESKIHLFDDSTSLSFTNASFLIAIKLDCDSVTSPKQYKSPASSPNVNCSCNYILQQKIKLKCLIIYCKYNT